MSLGFYLLLAAALGMKFRPAASPEGSPPSVSKLVHEFNVNGSNKGSLRNAKSMPNLANSQEGSPPSVSKLVHEFNVNGSNKGSLRNAESKSNLKAEAGSQAEERSERSVHSTKLGGRAGGAVKRIVGKLNKLYSSELDLFLYDPHFLDNKQNETLDKIQNGYRNWRDLKTIADSDIVNGITLYSRDFTWKRDYYDPAIKLLKDPRFKQHLEQYMEHGESGKSGKSGFRAFEGFEKLSSKAQDEMFTFIDTFINKTGNPTADVVVGEMVAKLESKRLALDETIDLYSGSVERVKNKILESIKIDEPGVVGRLASIEKDDQKKEKASLVVKYLAEIYPKNADELNKIAKKLE